MTKKNKISKRQKVFNVISDTIDIVQEYYLRGVFFMFVILYAYLVLKIDTIADFMHEMGYMQIMNKAEAGFVVGAVLGYLVGLVTPIIFQERI